MFARGLAAVTGTASRLRSRPRLTQGLALLALIGVTATVYWPVTGHGFLSLDDPEYVSENSTVRDGLTIEGLHWAFSAAHEANWHPVSWLSHMLDVELFGLGAAVYERLGSLFLDAQKLDAALEHFDRGLAIEPHRAALHHGVGLIWSHRGRFAEALAWFERARDHDPSYAPVYNDLGTAHARLGSPSQAIEAYKKALELDPKNELARLHYARMTRLPADAPSQEGNPPF